MKYKTGDRVSYKTYDATVQFAYDRTPKEAMYVIIYKLKGSGRVMRAPVLETDITPAAQISILENLAF